LFYYKTDDQHTQGYWSNSDSVLLTNPTATITDHISYNENGEELYNWDCGDTHDITYKDSTNEYQWNFEDISMIYTYWWITLPKSKLYNVPNKPDPVEEVE